MCQFLINRFVKPFVCKNYLRHNNNSMTRWFSSMPVYPYILLDYMLKLGDSGNDSSDGSIAIRKGLSKEERRVVIKESQVIEDICNVMTLGYYNGALKVGMLDKTILADTDNVRLYIYYKPSECTSNIVYVRLPHLPTGSVVQNIAMTSYPDLDNEDWVVAVKFFGSRIKLYRPSESRWIDVKAMPQSINTSSSLMYSKKDQRFYVPTPGSEFLYTLHPNSKENDHAEFVEFVDHLSTFDLLDEHLHRELDDSTTTVHFVEAPSGQQFLVKWFFMDELEVCKGMEQVTHKTRQFMVFRAEDHPGIKDQKHLFYTENIGDLCIFLGHGEAFCVRASDNPGLKPNCIYFTGYNFGVYDMTAKCCNIFYNKFYGEEGPLRSSEFPYWPHPLCLDS